MKYSLSQLRESLAAGARPEYLFFWGHQPSADGSITASCLSQWWMAPFRFQGREYYTAEHWMMACKARLFGDEEILEEIFRTDSPAAAKELGRRVSGFDGKVWDQHKYEFVREGNLHKFGQHIELQKYLLSTGEKVIVEASPYDRIWGIGLRAGDKASQHPDTWQGQNLLGFALMEVRDMIR
jgi:ribA/ribD-fused uncharacterized protein